MTRPRPPDLLVARDERPARRTRSRRPSSLAAGALALLLVGASAVLEQRERSAHEQQAAARAAAAVELVLRPGRVPTPRTGHLRRSLHVVVANEGVGPVQLVRGSLAPGRWQVQVRPDTVVRPGRLTVLQLSPAEVCSPELPRRLQLSARLADGRTATETLDLSHAHLADGGRLDEAMTLAAASCSARSPAPSSSSRS